METSKIISTRKITKKNHEPCGKTVHNGYIYYKDRVSTSGRAVYHYCATRRTTKCHARLIVAEDGTATVTGTHVEERDFPAIDAARVTADMLKKARTGMATREILISAQSNLHVSVLSRLPKESSSIRLIQKAKAEAGFARAPEPKTLASISIPIHITMSHGEQLLLHDSGSNDPDRFFMFGSKQTLEYLAQARVWHVDGTFTVPMTICQLWIIHASMPGGAVPCVFCLLPSKSAATYRKALAVLKNLKPEAEPDLIIADFERAERNAFQAEYNVPTHGCYFHLSQSVYRHAKSLGLEFFYQRSYKILTYIRVLWTLAFVPREDVPETFEIMRTAAKADLEDEQEPDVIEKLMDLYDYFYQYYVGDSARFPVSMWNWFDLTECSVRSNNDAEAFHKQLNNGITGRKTAVGVMNDVIPRIIKEIGFAETRGIRKQLDLKEKQKQISVKENRITNFMQNWQSCDTDEEKFQYVTSMVELLIALQR